LNGKPTGIVAKLVKASQSILSYPSNYSQVIERRKCWVKQSVHNSQQPSPNWKKQDEKREERFWKNIQNCNSRL